MEFLQRQRLETTVAVAVAVVAVAAGAAYLFLRSRKPRGEPFALSVTNNPRVSGTLAMASHSSLVCLLLIRVYASLALND
jgi:hypothetical protein